VFEQSLLGARLAGAGSEARRKRERRVESHAGAHARTSRGSIASCDPLCAAAAIDHGMRLPLVNVALERFECQIGEVHRHPQLPG
jgi:hypothetical protein